MSEVTFDDLIKHAKGVLGSRQLANRAWAGSVSAALLSEKGKVYTGVCIDVCAGMGFCAEHAAIAAMVTAGESRILKIVAIKGTEAIPPCGRCREFINQIHDDNINTEIMIGRNQVVTLKELLPFNINGS